MRTPKVRLLAFGMLASLSVLANADVRYSFSSPPYSFSLVTSTYVTSPESFGTGDLESYTSSSFDQLQFVQFYPDTGLNSSDLDLDGQDTSGAPFQYSFYFPANAFSGDGVYQTVSGPGGGSGTLTVQAVPEPITFAAFGLGALGTLRRRARRKS